MKRILTTIIIASLGLIMGGNADAQTLKNILNKVTGNSTVTDIVESVTGMSITPKDIKGSWNYSGSAIKLESEDILKSASAAVAVGQVEKKIDEYLTKVGVKPGLFSFTFNEDQTFCTTYKGKDFNGTYTLSEDGKTLTLTYGKILNSHAINANVNIGTESIELLFKADKLLNLIGKISATSDNATLKAISSLAGQYDGMKVGMKMTK